MSTHSTLTVKCLDGKWRSVYVHSDGYLEGVGKELLTKYNNQTGAELLVSDGDLNTVLETVLSYKAWRNEDAPTLVSDQFIECEEDFNYIWDGVRWSESANPEWNRLTLLDIIDETLKEKIENETVTIDRDEYDRLLKADDWLRCLEAAGVDNWRGIDEAIRMMNYESQD